MERNALDKTTYFVKDLGDQPKGLYLFRAEVGTGDGILATQIWCDDIMVRKNYIDVLVLNGDTPESIATFPSNCNWLLLSASLIETVSRRESYELMGKTQAAGEEARAIFVKAYEKAAGGLGKGSSSGPKVDELGPTNWDEFLKNIDKRQGEN